MLPWRRADEPDDPCRCRPTFDDPTGVDHDRVVLDVDAGDCPGGGDLAAAPNCRATVVDALADRNADAVRTRAGGRERRYVDDAAGLLLAAGRFVDRVRFRDDALAARALHDPLAAGREADGRAGPVATAAAETGLAEGAARFEGYDDALRAHEGPSLARSLVATAPPPNATLLDRRTLSTGAVVRRYDTPDGERYHLVPREHRFDDGDLATLADAASVLAGGGVEAGERAPRRAVRAVAEPDAPVEALASALRKHTRGVGVLADLFADPRLSDAFVTAPATANPVRVVVDGETLPTNVRPTPGGVAALASRFRRVSGRAFSRASPRLDASLDPATTEGEVRVAGVTDPVSDGPAFAFRRHGDEAWTLPRLVGNGTLPAEAAALLSVAVERGAACLLAGARGAGKTTALGALLWELPERTRAVVMEDTAELPVDSLQATGRDVQHLRVDPDGTGTSPDEALRTALRLGDGALVVGEIRGPAAGTLFEAMRVGAADGAVLGTVHGEGADGVRERVVSDMGVPESAFGATDLVVTLVGGDRRRVAAIEEVRTDGGEVAAAPLFELVDGDLAATGLLARGDSALAADLAGADADYAAVLDAFDERAAELRDCVAADATRPADLRAMRGR